MGAWSRYAFRFVLAAPLVLCIALCSTTWAKTKTCDATNLGEPCSRDDKEGTCGKGECCRLDYENRKPDLPPPQVCEPCILCIVPYEPPVLEKLTPTFPDVESAPPSEPTDATPAPPTPIEPDAGPEPAPDKDATSAAADEKPAQPAADALSAQGDEPSPSESPSARDSAKVDEVTPEAKGGQPQLVEDSNAVKTETPTAQTGPVGGAKGQGAPVARGADEEPVTVEDVLWSVGLLLALALLFFLVRSRRLASKAPDEKLSEGDA